MITAAVERYKPSLDGRLCQKPSDPNLRRLFAQRKFILSTPVWDNADLLLWLTRARYRFSCCKFHSAVIGELDITSDERSKTFKYVFRANRKAHRRAIGAVHC